MIQFSLYLSGYSHGVHEPKEWDKEWIHKEHDGLFINNSVRMAVIIIKSDRLNSQGHESSSKEESQT